MDDREAMTLALAEAAAALEHGDVPIGAVALVNGEVVARRHNERELTGDPTAHAELLALRDAAKVLGRWRLDSVTLVVTLEPCRDVRGCARQRTGRPSGVRRTRPEGRARSARSTTCASTLD